VDEAIVLAAVGDVFLDRPRPDEAFAGIRHAFAAADVVFGNCEGVYSDAPDRAMNAIPPTVAPVANAAALGRASFDVMSAANNHIMDGGYAGLRSTIDALRQAGVAPVGAGDDVAEAFAPVVVEAKGRRVAFVAVASFFPVGSEARAGLPGLAPLRAQNTYVPAAAGHWAPGMAPRVLSMLDGGDASRVEDAIGAARDLADVVVVSAHWGDFTRPYVVTDHERECAQLFVDAGADVVLGHHQHTLRGIEFYEERPILYGLSHWALDLPGLVDLMAANGLPSDEEAALATFGPYGVFPRAGYPLLPFAPESRMTVAAIVSLPAGGTPEVGLIPVMIRPSGAAEPVDPAEDEGRCIADYLNECCSRAGFRTVITPAGRSFAGHSYLVARCAD
jgi:Bacterial capsule synthesis protein PGA_cap